MRSTISAIVIASLVGIISGVFFGRTFSTIPSRVSITNHASASSTESIVVARVLLAAALSDASSSASEVLAKTDPLFSGPNGASSTVFFDSDPSIIQSLNSGREEANDSFVDIQKATADISSATSPSDLAPDSARIKTDLAEIKLFVDNASVIVDGINASSTATSSVTSWQIDLASARAKINQSISAILAADAVSTGQSIIIKLAH